MLSTSRTLRDLREERGLTQKDIARILGINNQVISMYERGERSPSFENLATLADFYKVPVDYIMGRTDANVDFSRFEKTKEIPVLGSVPCGIPIEAVEDVIDMIDIPASWSKGGKEFIGLLVKGDSMEPQYIAGDIVIIELKEDCESGDDAVVFVGDYEATLKRIKKIGNRIILQPLNPKYEPMTCINDGTVKVLGVVKEMRRYIK